MLYFCIIFIHKLLEDTLLMKIHFDCIMSAFCIYISVSGLRFLINQICSSSFLKVYQTPFYDKLTTHKKIQDTDNLKHILL